MKAPQTIPRSGPQGLYTNYQALLREGMEHCRKLSSDLWTDYNQHDPGITILEQLCYAITDLSYRTDFPIQDILEPPPGVAPPEQPLFTGDQILTCNPVTAADYRKLLFDRVTGLKNAWLVPMEKHPLGVRGLYEVLVETREEIRTDAEADSLRQQVEACLRSTRNLAEDVERVVILKPQPIRVEATVEIDPHSNPVTVLAQILFNIQNSLSPYPKARPVEELRQHQQPDEIWNGPRLNLGALDQDSLKPLKRSVDVQEIVNIVLQVRGVKRVKALRASSPPDAASDSTIQIKEGCVPRLDPPILEILKPQESYTINMEFAGGVKWHVDHKAVWAKIRELEANMRNSKAYAIRSFEALSYLRVPSGKYKEIEKYFSIQHQFPVVYGLSKYGAADNLVEGLVPLPKKERQARIQQLKAYLLFFEQLLANYLAQLSQVGRLFSLDEKLDQTYFYQELAHQPPLPSDPRNILDVLIQENTGTPRSVWHYWVQVVDLSGKIGFVSALLSHEAEAGKLRNRIIESGQHARNYRIRERHGKEYHLTLHDAGGELLAVGQEEFSTSEAAKAAGERWITFMTGLVRVKHLLERLVKIERRQALGLVVIDEGSHIVLASTGIPSAELRELRISEIISYGTDPRNYRFTSLAGRFRVQLHNTRSELIAEGEETFTTKFKAEAGVDRLVGLMVRVAQQKNLRDHHIRPMGPEVVEISKNPLRSYSEHLAELRSQNDSKCMLRRDNILNHLLARFGERFDDDILAQLDLRPFGEKDDFYLEKIRWKIEFLRSYIETSYGASDGAPQSAKDSDISGPDDNSQRREPGLGSGRGQGFDYGTSDGCNAVSGMERRLSLLLGFHGHQDGNEYRHTDKEVWEDSGFYYVEKKVSKAEKEQIKDEHDQVHDVHRHRILSSWRAGEPDLHDLHHNFVFSSEDSGIFRHLLSFGTNRENYLVVRAGDEHHVLFHSPNSDHATEIHHAIGKEEAEQAITSLIRYLQEVKESAARSYAGERLWVLEHVLLRPRRNTQHSPVRISHHEAGIHLTSHPLPKEHRDKHLELMLQYGQQHANYKIEADRFGDHAIVLYQQQTPIADVRGWAGEREAKIALDLLVELIRLIAKDRHARKKHASVQADDTFYSHRITVFLPNWPPRFQSNEFKLYAEQMVQENCPAHLSANCIWLSAYDMKSFEKMFSEWKSLKRSFHAQKHAPDAGPVGALDEASETLKHFIEKLQREQQRWAAETRKQ